jgi:hypothetical protein
MTIFVMDPAVTHHPSRCFIALAVVVLIMLPTNAQAKRATDVLDHVSVTDYLMSFLKVTIACSPIIIIATILLCAREDEEEEKAKLEAAKKSKSCKS